MVKYRIRLKYQTENDISKNRENNINGILSDIDLIESDTPIRKPLDNEVIIISGQEYKVSKVSISFEKEGDITYYDFIVLLKSKEEEKESESDWEKRLKEALTEKIRGAYPKSGYDYQYKQDLIKKEQLIKKQQDILKKFSVKNSRYDF